MQIPTHIVAVGGIVEDDQGNILLVKTKHGGWVFPGGQVEVGENLIDALIREVKEESGIDVTVSNLIGVYSNTGKHKGYDGVTDIPTKVMMDFVCKPVGGELDVSDETTDSRWVKKDEVLDYVETPAYRTRYQAYLDFTNQTHYMEYVTHPTFELKQKRMI
ncbi:NUDIX hydrolase [Aquibacillus koreensis]|uniref:NUDIX hydrolase n=1 Tax=Aquibacillus koreensis TaxID=279446 RepID=A0A9X4AKT7_9BACI|nr:NUDIX hydrolase [Aquibacillus koreensis]MCT2534426.1 NUDIX hydrolase [Aquibacillus koreensis]MDC3421733.1 NUDIX hydrolase [Aquibacillus koreensis]